MGDKYVVIEYAYKERVSGYGTISEIKYIRGPFTKQYADDYVARLKMFLTCEFEIIKLYPE